MNETSSPEIISLRELTRLQAKLRLPDWIDSIAFELSNVCTTQWGGTGLLRGLSGIHLLIHATADTRSHPDPDSKTHIALVTAHQQAITDVRRAIMASLPETLINELKVALHPDPPRAWTLEKIINTTINILSTWTRMEIDTVVQGFGAPITSVASFRNETISLQIRYSQIQQFRPQNEADKVARCKTSIAHLPAMTEAAQDYLKRAPGEPCLKDLVEYLNDQIDRGTIPLAAPLSSPSVNHHPPAPTHQVSNASAIPTTATKVRTPTTPLDYGSYCFLHGPGHAGSACKRMAADTKYTKDMKAAKGPCTLPDSTGTPINGNPLKPVPPS